MNRNKYFQLLFLILLTIVTFFVYLGLFEPDIMEARNFVTAREMLLNKQWLLPTMNGLPRLEKPPFPTWFTASTLYLFGSNLFWMRFPAAIMGCVLTYFTFRMALRLFGNKQEAVVSVVVLLTIPMVVIMGRTGSWDVFCQASMLGGVYFLHRFLVSNNPQMKYLIFAALFTGFSAMSKGPVAIYTTLIPYLCAYFFTYGTARLKGRWSQMGLFLIVAGILSSWWYIYIYFNAPEIGQAIAEKEIKARAERHMRPFYFYLSFPVFTGIWSIIIVSIFFIKNYLKKVSNQKEFKFLVIWIVCAIFLLSIIPEKKERFLLPIYPPLAILVAHVFSYLARTPLALATRTERITSKVFHITLIIGLFAAPLVAFFMLMKQNHISAFVWVVFTTIMSILVIKAIENFRNGKLMRQISIIGIASAGFIILPLSGLPEVIYKNPNFKDIRQIQREKWYKEYDFYTISEINPKAIWRIGKKVTKIERHNMWPDEDFIFITEYPVSKSIQQSMQDSLEIKKLGTYHYFRKKSDYRLNIHEMHWTK